MMLSKRCLNDVFKIFYVPTLDIVWDNNYKLVSKPVKWADERIQNLVLGIVNVFGVDWRLDRI